MKAIPRRDFIKISAIGTAGMAIGGMGFSAKSYAAVRRRRLVGQATRPCHHAVAHLPTCGGRFAEREIGCALAEERDELVVDDIDDLLAGHDPLEHVLPDALGLHARDEVARDLEMHVGREQSGAHLSEGGGHVGLREPADAAKIAE